MAEPTSGAPDFTWIGGRPVEAFNAHGQTTVVDLRWARIGPPARPVSSPGTSFVVFLRYHGGADSDTPGREVVIRREAGSLWNALLDARSELDATGWLLPIAAARADRWCVYSERYFGVGVVHPFDDVETSEGILQPAPRETIGTVAEQRRAYQEWVDANADLNEVRR